MSQSKRLTAMDQTDTRSLAKPHVSRRSTLACGGATALLGLSRIESAHATNGVIDVTARPYNASPSLPDNTKNFQAALDAIQSCGGGVLQVPPGLYVLQGPLSYSGGSLSVVGFGQALSVLVIGHAATALSYTANVTSADLIVRDIGFSPFPGGTALAGTAIAVTVPSGPSAWQNCLIENVDFGVPYGANGSQYTNFTNAISLTNAYRARISNCNGHGNVYGGTFVFMSGMCVDCRVVSCNVDGYTTGISVNSYSEGLHLIDSVLICGTALVTGTSAFGGRINLLGLYIDNCELNCRATILSLYQVTGAWITNSNFYGPRAATGSIACLLSGAARIQISHCLFGGFFSTTAPSNQVAIATTASSTQPAFAISIDDCEFENTTTAVQLGSGSTNVTAGLLRMFQPGDSALVDTPIVYGTVTQQVVADNSGNASNDISWFATSNGDKHHTHRVEFER